jgi:predicted enzyme related to lactoylglutathione lyase
MRVDEVFFSVYVRDMERAISFYENALGANVEYETATWSSVTLAGVRFSLVLAERPPVALGMHLIVDNVALACAAVTYEGGAISPAVEMTHGTIFAEIFDTEGNMLTLRQTTTSSLAKAA